MCAKQIDLSESLNYINGHLTDNLTVEGIAEISGYSLHHFCRIFADSFGVTPGAYIKRERMKLACRDLLGGESVTDVSKRYGYKTLSGFYKAFTSVYGVGPRQMVVDHERDLAS
ncbi:MAG: helix-turn-helix transcriptional regulator [Coriobacteriales bacterium]|nr:helix-turn-helix transcriptional regulator [Coriobacteriales bacterium]